MRSECDPRKAVGPRGAEVSNSRWTETGLRLMARRQRKGLGQSFWTSDDRWLGLSARGDVKRQGHRGKGE
jgi:hypothetical protein